jgi:hypothetical protein
MSLLDRSEQWSSHYFAYHIMMKKKENPNLTKNDSKDVLQKKRRESHIYHV